MTNQDRMLAALAENPQIGRCKLSSVANVSLPMAQRFLKKQRQATINHSQEKGRVATAIATSGLSEQEVLMLLQSAKNTPKKVASSHKWGRDSFKIGVVADTHFGHQKSNGEWWARTCDFIGREKCQLVLHIGDITEGMSGRPGHIYELDAVGVTAQVNLAAQRLAMLPCSVEAITGNHDAWTMKAVGVDIGEMLQGKLPGKYKHLGADEADVVIDGVTIKLWHGGDGSSYATSYRTQKFIEGLTGGEKPHILLSGHAHKSIYHTCRNVMVFESGTLCGQTGWMRGKKLAAHVGFWIIEVWPAPDGGIERIRPEWIPFFK